MMNEKSIIDIAYHYAENSPKKLDLFINLLDQELKNTFNSLNTITDIGNYYKLCYVDSISFHFLENIVDYYKTKSVFLMHDLFFVNIHCDLDENDTEYLYGIVYVSIEQMSRMIMCCGDKESLKKIMDCYLSTFKCILETLDFLEYLYKNPKAALELMDKQIEEILKSDKAVSLLGLKENNVNTKEDFWNKCFPGVKKALENEFRDLNMFGKLRIFCKKVKINEELDPADQSEIWVMKPMMKFIVAVLNGYFIEYLDTNDFINSIKEKTKLKLTKKGDESYECHIEKMKQKYLKTK